MRNHVSISRILVLLAAGLSIIGACYFINMLVSQISSSHEVCKSYIDVNRECPQYIIQANDSHRNVWIIKTVSSFATAILIPLIFQLVEKNLSTSGTVKLRKNERIGSIPIYILLPTILLCWFMFYFVVLRIFAREHFVMYDTHGGPSNVRNILTFQCDPVTSESAQWYHIGREDLFYQSLYPCKQPNYLVPIPFTK